MYGRRNKDGTHSEGTSFEAPSFIQGELPTLTTEQTSLISQISSSYRALESDSQVHQHSSDMVHETVLTTQNQHLDGERLLAGVDLDDTITNMGVSSVFTEDPIVTLAPSCAQSSSQMNRFEGSTLEGELSKSSPIQLEVPLEGITPLKTLAEIVLVVEARSTIANDPVMGEASSSHLCDSALQGAQRFEAGVHDSNPVNSSPISIGGSHYKWRTTHCHNHIAICESNCDSSHRCLCTHFSGEMSMISPIWSSSNHMITYYLFSTTSYFCRSNNI